MNLLPCAHCGKQDSVEIIRTNYPGERKVICNHHNGGCGANTAGGDTPEEAIAAWNRRAVPTGYKLVAGVPEPTEGWYLQDTRKIIGNCTKFWYQHGYGTKVKNFHVFASKEEALARSAPWFVAWYKPYIDSLAELTVDCQLLNRAEEQLMIQDMQVSGHE